MPATCWSNHTQVEPARVTRGCGNGHSVCQQTNQWKGWTPSLSERGHGCRWRRWQRESRDVSRAATAEWHGPKNGKILKSQCRRWGERNPPGGEGSFAVYCPHISWTCRGLRREPSARLWMPGSCFQWMDIWQLLYYWWWTFVGVNAVSWSRIPWVW